MSDKYSAQRINPELLSVLDVVSEGKVVSAETWNKLWSLVIQRINNIDAFCISLETVTQSWQTATEALRQTYEALQKQYDVLEKSFVHYGEDAPNNPLVRFWIQPSLLSDQNRFVSYSEAKSIVAEALSSFKMQDRFDEALEKAKAAGQLDYKLSEDDKLNLSNAYTNALKGQKVGGPRMCISDVSPAEHFAEVHTNAFFNGAYIGYYNPLTFDSIPGCTEAYIKTTDEEFWYWESIGLLLNGNTYDEDKGYVDRDRIINVDTTVYDVPEEDYNRYFSPKVYFKIVGSEMIVDVEVFYSDTGELVKKKQQVYQIPENTTVTGLYTERDNAHNYEVEVLNIQGLTIKQYSRQLLPPMKAYSNVIAPSLNFVRSAYGEITLNGTVDVANSIHLSRPITLPAGTYTLSGVPTGSANGVFTWLRNTNNTSEVIARDYGDGATFTLTKETTLESYIKVLPGTYNNFYVYCQLEAGTEKTELEYPTEFITDNSTITGVVAQGPTLMLTTDSNDVVFDCTYNKDINKAFAELQQAILSLGGNV